MADQQLHVVRVLSQGVRNLVDVGGFRAALGCEIGGCHIGANISAVTAHQTAALMPSP